jgi:Leucine-rich repeat (LRR) protein
MFRPVGLTIALAGWLLAAASTCALDCPPDTEQADRDYDAAVKALKKAGARLTVDGRQRNDPVIGVDLHDKSVTDETLEQLKLLTDLQTLNLKRARITGAGLKHIEGLKNLVELDLTRTVVRDEGIAHLKGLTKLRTLRLDCCGIRDAGLAHLKGLTSLETLDLFDNEVEGPGLVHLQDLQKLRLLEIGDNIVREPDRATADLKKKLPKLTVKFQFKSPE